MLYVWDSKNYTAFLIYQRNRVNNRREVITVLVPYLWKAVDTRLPIVIKVSSYCSMSVTTKNTVFIVVEASRRTTFHMFLYYGTAPGNKAN